MSLFLWAVVITFIAGVCGTGLGGCIGGIFKKDNSKIVSLLLSFAGGIMLAVVCFDLILEALNPDGATESVNVFLVIFGILLGYGVVYAINLIIDKKTNIEVSHIDEDHPKTADSLEELIHYDHYSHHAREAARDSESRLFGAGIIMALAIALHNIPEGMVIGASIARDGTIQSSSGLVLAIVIGLHNIPEGMAVSVPLITGGMKKWLAVVMTALSGLPTVIGAMLGYALGTLGAFWLSLSLSFASGAMLYVVFGELLPESILMWKSKLPAFAILVGIFVGMIIIYV